MGTVALYCKCDKPVLAFFESATGAAVCKTCGNLIPCEFCLLLEDNDYPSSQQLVDYWICDRHLDAAADAIDTREYMDAAEVGAV